MSVPSREEVQARFNKFDTDGSGEIELKELLKMFSEPPFNFAPEKAEQAANKILSRYDGSDGNKKVTFEEFYAEVEKSCG